MSVENGLTGAENITGRVTYNVAGFVVTTLPHPNGRHIVFPAGDVERDLPAERRPEVDFGALLKEVARRHNDASDFKANHVRVSGAGTISTDGTTININGNTIKVSPGYSVRTVEGPTEAVAGVVRRTIGRATLGLQPKIIIK